MEREEEYFEIDGFTYQIVNIDGAMQAWLIAIQNKDVYVVSIPETILCNDNKIPVTKIGKDCFHMCLHLQRIDIPPSIKHIDNGCFACCFDLIEIKLPDQLETIGEKCFLGCQKLSEITIPASVRYIDDSAFQGCRSLKRIQIFGTGTRFRNRCFSQCEKLEDITFPNDECMIYESCVYGCEKLNENTRKHIKTREIGKFEARYRRYESFIEKLSKSIVCQHIKKFLKVFLTSGIGKVFIMATCIVLVLPILVIAMAWFIGIPTFDYLESRFNFRHENAIAYCIATLSIGLMLYVLLFIIAIFINTGGFNMWNYVIPNP